MLANEVERLKPPQYVAFRTMERWVVIPVIARIESREGGRLMDIGSADSHPKALSEKSLSTMSSSWETTTTQRSS